MKALSILQPWAWLIVSGHKPVENRTWVSSFRGRLIVHAGKRWGREQREDLEYVQDVFPEIVLPEKFDRGGIVGAVTMIDCVNDHPSPFFNGPKAFVLADPEQLPFTPLRGSLGIFDIPDELVPPSSCQTCGCTWTTPCPGGCSWVAPGLCSACDGSAA
jgi:hypothetical protein